MKQAILAIFFIAMIQPSSAQNEALLRRENHLLRLRVDSLERVLREREKKSLFSWGFGEEDETEGKDTLRLWSDLAAQSPSLVSLSEIDTILKIPYDAVVEKYLRIYLVEKRDNMVCIMRRYDLYAPYMKKMFARHGIPEEFTLLSVVESAVNPVAVSRAGAVGMWQLMEDTAREAGLTVNILVDERTDPERSTEAAATILENAFRRYGSWPLAILSYNCGDQRLEQSIAQCGTDATLDRIRKKLPDETAQYLQALAATMLVAGNRALLTQGDGTAK